MFAFLPFTYKSCQNGNVLFIILLAVVLIGALTAAIQMTSRPEGANIDRETLILRVSEVQAYVNQLKRGVLYITQQNRKSESDLRFAHPKAHTNYGDLASDTETGRQVFHPQGGAVTYQAPPEGINDGSPWEFYGATHAPSVGSERADLMIVLPNVTTSFCARINDAIGQNETLKDTGSASATGSNPGACVYAGSSARFNDTVQFYNSANTMDETSFVQDDVTNTPKPAPQGCVQCSSDGRNHFYAVIMTR